MIKWNVSLLGKLHARRAHNFIARAKKLYYDICF